MKYLMIAFGMSFGASLALFGILNQICEFEAHAAYGFAGLPFIGMTHLYEALERKSAARQVATDSSAGAAIPALDGFALSWKVMIVYGTISFVAAVDASGFLAGIWIACFAGTQIIEQNPALVIAIAMPITMAAAYFLGRWIGGRCAQYGLRTVLIAATAGILLAKTIDFLILGDADFEKIYGSPKEIDTLLFHFMGGVILVNIFSLIGYWRGRRRRLLNYLKYLLGILPKETRELIVNLAYEEVQNISSPRAFTGQPLRPGQQLMRA